MKNNRYILTKMEKAVDNNLGKRQQTGHVTNITLSGTTKESQLNFILVKKKIT